VDPLSDAARKLTLFVHATLDGFIATGDGTFWTHFPWGEAEMRWNNDQFRKADTWVLGRTMYEAIVPWWMAIAAGTPPEDAGEITPATREFADLLAGMTKIVVSRTLKPTEEREVIAADVPAALEQLKRRSGRDIALSCGPGLLGALAGRPGLIDEYLVILHPTAIGAGIPLFPPLSHEVALDLAATKAFGSGALALRYRPHLSPAARSSDTGVERL
jgi:dihydrofolate reductase